MIDSLGGGMGGADGWVDSKFVRGKDGGRGGWKRVVGLVLLGGVECVVWVVGMLWGLFVDRVLRGILGKRMKIE